MSTEDIKAGDIVMLSPTATYYNGRIIPAWVKKEQWIVMSVNGDRVVINENVSHTHAIKSPVNKRNLYKVKV